MEPEGLLPTTQHHSPHSEPDQSGPLSQKMWIT